VKSWLASALGLLVMVCAFTTKPTGVDDFPEFYSAAHHTGAVYSPAVYEVAHHFLPFVRIPSYAWMLQPVASFPYPVARAIWLLTLAAALVAFALLWPDNRKRNIMALCWSVPVAFGFALGQDSVFVLLIAALAVFLRMRNHNLAAGLVIALLAFKITFLLALAIPFLRSRRSVTGMAIGLAAQFGLSFALDPGWVGEYVAILRSPKLDLELLRMPSIRAVTSVLPFPGVLFAIGFTLLIFWLWRITARVPLAEGVSAAMAIALIAAPHCYVYDAILLIPALARRASLNTWPGRAALFGLSPFPFLAILNLGSRPIAFLGGTLLVISTCVALAWGNSAEVRLAGRNESPADSIPESDRVAARLRLPLPHGLRSSS
jgi:hypothetical protein